MMHGSSRLWKLEEIVKTLLSLFVLGYVIVFFSTLFKGGCKSSKTENELTKERFDSSFLRQQLIEKNREILHLKSEKSELQSRKLEAEKQIVPQAAVVPAIGSNNNNRPGVIILGMHRSGTSVLGGLINKMGLKTGGPLIAPAEDNEKGFFERIDVVLQNDYIMKNQGVHYSFNTFKFDALQGLKDILNNRDKHLFAEGRKAIAFFNDKNNYPWMLKDPRLCITFRMWLPLFNFVPAVLFTYRHPLDVALSMHKREFEQFRVKRGLRLWYVYNRRAVLQSHDLCRVRTSHHAIIIQPQQELTRIFTELKACGVPVPHKLSAEDISDFIDIKLQHGRSTLKDDSCSKDIAAIVPPDSWQTEDEEEIQLYRESMRVYCALEDGTAFKPEFEWDSNIRDD